MLCPPSASEYFVATFRKLICFITLTLIRSEIIIVDTEYHLLILMKMRFSSRLIYYFIEHPLALLLSATLQKCFLTFCQSTRLHCPSPSTIPSLKCPNTGWRHWRHVMSDDDFSHQITRSQEAEEGRGRECWCLKVCFLCLTPAHCSAQ